MKHSLITTLLFTLFAPFITSCTSSDWDDEENQLPSSYVEPVNVSGYWYQSGAKLNGNSAYLGLHITSSGKGHATFYAKSAGIASFDDINTSVEGSILTINNCDAFKGNFLVENVTSSSLKLRQGNTIYTYYKGKELSPENLATKSYWTLSSTGSSNYWRYYFRSDKTGELYQYYNGKSSTFPFNYTCSSETGSLTINYTNPGINPDFYDYACLLNSSLLLTFKEGTQTYWQELK